MGENTQSGPLRIVIVLGLIALIGLVVLTAVGSMNKSTSQKSNRTHIAAGRFITDDDTISDHKYSYHDDGTATIYGFKLSINMDTELIVPKYIKHNGKRYIVTAIGSGAYHNAGLTTVILPDSVKTIGAYAFQGNKLTSVSLPSSIEVIDEGAFYGNSLRNLDIPGTVKVVGRIAFQYNQLTDVIFNEGTTTIDEGAFNNNKLLTVNLPDSVKTVGPWAFSENKLREDKVYIGKNTSYVNLNDKNASFGFIVNPNVRH